MIRSTHDLWASVINLKKKKKTVRINFTIRRIPVIVFLEMITGQGTHKKSS